MDHLYTKTLTMRLAIDVTGLSDEEIAILEDVLLDDVPQALQPQISFQVLHERNVPDLSPQHAEKMLQHIHKEFARYDNRHVYRPARYDKLVGDES